MAVEDRSHNAAFGIGYWKNGTAAFHRTGDNLEMPSVPNIALAMQEAAISDAPF